MSGKSGKELKSRERENESDEWKVETGGDEWKRRGVSCTILSSIEMR